MEFRIQTEQTLSRRLRDLRVPTAGAASDNKGDCRNELRIDVSGALCRFAGIVIAFSEEVAIGRCQFGYKSHRVERAETKRGFGMFDRGIEAARIGMYGGAEGEDDRGIWRRCERPIYGVERDIVVTFE